MQNSDLEPISSENRAILHAQLQRLSEKKALPKPIKEPESADNALERNRAYLKSDQSWLRNEALVWAAANQDWVELICNAQGIPYELEAYF